VSNLEFDAPPLNQGDREISFGADVRQELALQVPARSCCQRSELQGIFDAAGALIHDGMASARLSTSSAARKAVRLGRLVDTTPDGQHGSHFRRGATHLRPSYRVGLPRSVVPADKQSPSRSCCRKSYLRGAFLAGGAASLTASGTHLEFVTRTRAEAEKLRVVMLQLGVRGQLRRRRRQWLVYLKGSDHIALLLAAMGASRAVLKLEDFRILRGIKAHASREANAETSNLRRVVASGLRQAEAVRRLIQSGLLEQLPPGLREIAQARAAKPSASLQQLADQLGVSKSAVAGRLRRLLRTEDAGQA